MFLNKSVIMSMLILAETKAFTKTNLSFNKFQATTVVYNLLTHSVGIS